MKILHVFADKGVESEVLTDYGDVLRLSINAEDTNASQPVRADAAQPPLRPDATFDLGVFQPPCTKWSDMPSADTDAAPNLIPEARELAERHCEHWLIENKPAAPLRDPTLLNGRMFGLPLKYERAFETSFPVSQPPAPSTLGRTEYQPFYHTEHSPEAWAAAKGYPAHYGQRHLSRNCIPRQMLLHLVQHWLEAADTGVRKDYSDYDQQMDAKRARESNRSLSEFSKERP